MNLEKGGRGAIERMVEAYGFKTRQALCDHLGISKSTLATRYMRDSFPAEWVIKCALDTKVSLDWLAFGTDAIQKPQESSRNENTVQTKLFKIVHGKLKHEDEFTFDKKLLICDEQVSFALETNESILLLSDKWDIIVDGNWLIDLDDETTLRSITKRPNKRLHVKSNDNEFECNADELKLLAKVIVTCFRG